MAEYTNGYNISGSRNIVFLSDEDRELLKQILLATKSLKPEEAPKRLQEPAEDLGSKSDYGLAS